MYYTLFAKVLKYDQNFTQLTQDKQKKILYIVAKRNGAKWNVTLTKETGYIVVAVVVVVTLDLNSEDQCKGERVKMADARNGKKCLLVTRKDCLKEL